MISTHKNVENVTQKIQNVNVKMRFIIKLITNVKINVQVIKNSTKINVLKIVQIATSNKMASVNTVKTTAKNVTTQILV